MKRFISVLVLMSLFMMLMTGCARGGSTSANTGVDTSDSTTKNEQMQPEEEAEQAVAPQRTSSEHYWSNDGLTFDLPAFCEANGIFMQLLEKSRMLCFDATTRFGRPATIELGKSHTVAYTLILGIQEIDGLNRVRYISGLCATEEIHQGFILDRSLNTNEKLDSFIDSISQVDIRYEGMTMPENVLLSLLTIIDEVTNDAADPFQALPYGSYNVAEQNRPNTESGWYTISGNDSIDIKEGLDISTYR